MPPNERVYSVSEITELIKARLEEDFPRIAIQGEISNFRPSSSGHWYFSLKDRDAVISVVMFRGRLDSVGFSPADGVLVKAVGGISVYAKRGSYQLICDSLVRAGEGDILAMIEERKRRLAAEGLFAAERKRPLPLYPARVAIVTSPTGAAVRDMLRVLRRRNAGIDVVILPTQVQGDGAEERIARQIEAANRHSLGDVIIVGRGGGSLEDLLPFSSETVVRAIAASRIPVISAIGHETDFVLSDFAADVRAATPSAAAELVASSRAELMARVRGLGAYIGDDLRRRLAMLRLKLEGASSESMVHAVKAHVQRMAQRADDAREDLVREMRRGAQTARHRMELGSRELASCSPVAVLGRGYAVVTHGRTGIVLHSADQVVTGEDIGIRLARGALRAMVEESYAGKGE